MIKLSIKEIVDSINGSIYIDGNEYKYTNIETDTRKLTQNCIFVALKGNNFNGNDFVLEAADKGSIICIVDEIKFNKDELNKGTTVILVKNTSDALLNLAETYRKKLDIKIIGITGSTGKTSTKDLTAAFLSSKYKVFKTKGNFNNAIGLPLMIFSLDETYDIAVLEMGMSDLGEIHALAKTCRPDIALITNIGISHIENLKTRENILKAKMEITDFFGDDNVLIVNSDNDMLKHISTNKFKIIKTSASGKDATDIKASSVYADSNGIEFDVFRDGTKDGHLTLPLIGVHNVENALLAYGAANFFGMTLQDMQKGVSNLECTSMRLDVLDIGNKKLIDDSYNASPDSMKAAIRVACTFEGRKVAILGSMGELGKESNSAHEEVGAFAKDNGIDVLITIGDYCESYKSGYGKNEFYQFKTIKEAEERINSILNDGDVVLIKASRFMHFEEIVKYLKLS